MKTASRILGTAFFLAGYEVQDAPRYGAERRGAPIFAFVRAAQTPINERGVITNPDLVVVADDSLVGIAAAGVMQGLHDDTTLLINSHEDESTWQHRLNTTARIITLPAGEETRDRADLPYVGSRCAAAAAALVGVIERDTLQAAIREELASLGDEIVSRNLETVLATFEQMQAHHGVVREGKAISAHDYQEPAWVELDMEDATVSAPAIHAGATTSKVPTGLWRTMRPVIDYDACKKCWWICGSYCPDGDISVSDEGVPTIDYEHCKGCLVCVAQCPTHAIEAVPEHQAQATESKEGSA
jgi:pyruvate ferredoxin oxidoreductase gamma subunit